MSSDTPRTDAPRTAALHEKLVRISEGPSWIAGKDYKDMADHARQLERELSTSRQECEGLRTNLRLSQASNKDLFRRLSNRDNELWRAEDALAKAKKQAEGLCDGCGAQLDDAFCLCCVDKRVKAAEAQLTSLQAAYTGAVEVLKELDGEIDYERGLGKKP